MQIDFITCNPPWLPAEFVVDSSPLDNGVYDPKEKFLNSCMNFASNINELKYNLFRNSFVTEGRDAFDL